MWTVTAAGFPTDPNNPVLLQPALLDNTGRAVPNPQHDPGDESRTGNLPFNQTNCVHTASKTSRTTP
jgi:alkaline phosphatase